MKNYDEIAEYIKNNITDSKGYEWLAEYYMTRNIKQAYLCLENALFYAYKYEDIERLNHRIDEVTKLGGKVPKVAMVILSYNNRKVTQACIESIRDTTPESAREIIVVDNASGDDSVEYLRQQKDIILRANDENAGFPKGCNQGIEMAQKDSEILLLNNDTVLMLNTLFWLRMGLYENEHIGSAGSVSNKAWKQWSGEKEGTLEEFKRHAELVNVPQEYPIEYRTWLVGFCLLIRRDVMDKLGGLDEGFSPGNGEDNDLGLRINKMGYMCVLVRNSYIVHMEHASFAKRPDYYRLIGEAHKKLHKKFGFHVDGNYYGNENICSFYSDRVVNGRVLEINCSIGGSLYEWHAKYPQNEYEGIDRAIESAEFRENNPIFKMSTYTDIKHTNVEGEFDCICLDTRRIKRSELDDYIQFGFDHLKPNGEFVISVRNMKFFREWAGMLLNEDIHEEDGSEIIILRMVEEAIKRHGMQAKLWMYSFINVLDDERGQQIEALLNNMPKDIANEARIKNKCIVAVKC